MMEKIKKFWKDYTSSINWYFVIGFWVLLTFAIILDGWTISKYLIMTGAWILLTIGSYFQSKIRMEASRKKNIKDEMKDRDKNDIHLPDGTVFVDWNKFTMDEMADYLERKWMFQSSGEALAIHKMVKFYRDNKDKV